MKNLIPAAVLLVASLSPAAHAATAQPGMQVVSNVGQWIAEQGNAALRDMREELKRDLKNRLRPLVPERPAAAR
ncbi:MAG TPA: hypothetical protein VJM11_08180 [Nevskiaceae bacterium]|nr:hypothetical protein [Nevskiaceae bacterium]